MNEQARFASAGAVAVTGMGCVCGAGLDLEQCLRTLFGAGRAPCAPSRFHVDHAADSPVFEVPEAFFTARRGDEPDLTLTVGFALSAAREALRQAGLTPKQLQGPRVGVCIGTTVGATLNNEPFYREYLAGGHPEMRPVRTFLNSNPAAALARRFKLSGPCQTVVNACSSGTDAIGIAAGWIAAGLCDVVLAGGADELCRFTCNGFGALKIMAPEPCRPFDRRRQGLNLGEGAGIMVLESARQSGRCKEHSDIQPRGYVLGYGSACDAHHLTAPHPEGAGLERALREALAISNATASDIAFINAHGTATRDNDRVEGIVLGRLVPDVPFVSTKGHTGHALGAAGGIEAVLTLACLNMGRIPPSAGFAEPDPEIQASPVIVEQPTAKTIALSQSLAFGGNNGVLALGRGVARQMPIS